MNICHVISSIDNSNGGPSRSATHLLSVLGKQNPNLKLHLHTYNSKDPIIRQFKCSNTNLSFYDLKSLGRFKGLKELLLKNPTTIFHGQGIWELPIHQMASVAREQKIPYIITPRGMLGSWSLSQRRLKKKIAMTLYQYKDLREAACLHATAQMEADSIRALGLKNPIAIIPNGVPLKDFKIKDFKQYRSQKKILFLSRIHPSKGLEVLIEAWSQISEEKRKEWIVEIVGNGDPNYIEELKRKIISNNLQSSIQFKGPLYGSDKVKAYHEADLFVLPTYSENFGIVVAEALACGTPVITTKGAPWQDLETYECGWWIGLDVKDLLSKIDVAMSLSKETLDEMGQNGRRLVEQKYSMSAVGRQMYTLYEWLDGKGEKPEFVV